MWHVTCHVSRVTCHISPVCAGGGDSGLASRQDSTQFEDALRRLHALERKLTDQVRTFPCDGCVQCLLYKGVEEHPVIKSDLSSPGLCVMTGRHRRPRDASQVTASASLLTLTGLYCRSKSTSENWGRNGSCHGWRGSPQTHSNSTKWGNSSSCPR